MSEYFEHNPGDHEDPLAGPTWLVGILGVVLLIIVVLGLVALYYNAQQVENAEKVITAKAQEVEQLTEQQRLRLQIPHQVRFEEEVATVIPIEDAMRVVAEQYGGSGQ